MAKKMKSTSTKKSTSPKKEKLSKKDATKSKKKKTKVEKLKGMRAGPPVKEKKRKKVKEEKPKKKTKTKVKKEASSLIAADIIERWKNGEALNVLAEVAGLKRSRFRRELTKAVGGKEKYQELRASGAGGTAKAVGRRSRNGNGASAPAAIDDSNVKRITKTRFADGWKSRVIYVDKVSTSVFTSPKGNEYVVAKGNEKADLIFQPKGDRSKGLDPVRLKKLASSSIGRKAAREQKLIEQGAKSEEARKQEKRAKRQMKKKGVVPEESVVSSVETPKKRSRKTRRKVN